MNLDNFSWIIAAAALFATWLNIQKDRRCFWIWIITNGFWAAYDIAYGMYAQAVLFMVYAALAVIGAMSWEGGQKCHGTSRQSTAGKPPGK
jgi:nicotinamide riboside transporter PnuC